MATKEEMSQELNRRLEIEIDWSELRKEDLEELTQMMDSTDLLQRLVNYHAKNMSKNQLDRLIDEWHPGKYAGRVL